MDFREKVEGKLFEQPNVYKVIYLGVAFSLLQTAYASFQEFLTLVMAQEDILMLANLSLGSLYLAFCFSEFFLSPFIFSMYNGKNRNILFAVTCLTFCNMMVSFTNVVICSEYRLEHALCDVNFHYFYCILSSIICGVGGSVIWLTQGIYMCKCCRPWNRGRFSGMFFLIFNTSLVSGNFMGYYILRNGHVILYYITCSIITLAAALMFLFAKTPVPLKKTIIGNTMTFRQNSTILGSVWRVETTHKPLNLEQINEQIRYQQKQNANSSSFYVSGVNHDLQHLSKYDKKGNKSRKYSQSCNNNSSILIAGSHIQPQEFKITSEYSQLQQQEQKQQYESPGRLLQLDDQQQYYDENCNNNKSNFLDDVIIEEEVQNEVTPLNRNFTKKKIENISEKENEQDYSFLDKKSSVKSKQQQQQQNKIDIENQEENKEEIDNNLDIYPKINGMSPRQQLKQQNQLQQQQKQQNFNIVKVQNRMSDSGNNFESNVSIQKSSLDENSNNNNENNEQIDVNINMSFQHQNNNNKNKQQSQQFQNQSTIVLSNNNNKTQLQNSYNNYSQFQPQIKSNFNNNTSRLSNNTVNSSLFRQQKPKKQFFMSNVFSDFVAQVSRDHSDENDSESGRHKNKKKKNKKKNKKEKDEGFDEYIDENTNLNLNQNETSNNTSNLEGGYRLSNNLSNQNQNSNQSKNKKRDSGSFFQSLFESKVFAEERSLYRMVVKNKIINKSRLKSSQNSSEYRQSKNTNNNNNYNNTSYNPSRFKQFQQQSLNNSNFQQDNNNKQIKESEQDSSKSDVLNMSDLPKQTAQQRKITLKYENFGPPSETPRNFNQQQQKKGITQNQTQQVDESILTYQDFFVFLRHNKKIWNLIPSYILSGLFFGFWQKLGPIMVQYTKQEKMNITYKNIYDDTGMVFIVAGLVQFFLGPIFGVGYDRASKRNKRRIMIGLMVVVFIAIVLFPLPFIDTSSLYHTDNTRIGQILFLSIGVLYGIQNVGFSTTGGPIRSWAFSKEKLLVLSFATYRLVYYLSIAFAFFCTIGIPYQYVPFIIPIALLIVSIWTVKSLLINHKY